MLWGEEIDRMRSIELQKRGAPHGHFVFMDWDYENREVHVSIPGYVGNALKRFKHTTPEKPQHQPYPHNPKQYGQKQQFSEPEDKSPPLGKEDKKFIQEVTGTFLFYARAVDPTMLVALSSLAAEQCNPTERTMAKCKQFLDYAATQEDAVITYRKSDMMLAIHSDASYLSEPKARSRAGGHFFLSENDQDPRDKESNWCHPISVVSNLAQPLAASRSFIFVALAHFSPLTT
jgi:hypothetical protein